MIELAVIPMAGWGWYKSGQRINMPAKFNLELLDTEGVELNKFKTCYIGKVGERNHLLSVALFMNTDQKEGKK